MIKKIFIPDSIGDYYLLGKTIVAIAVGKTHVQAVQLYAAGYDRTITKIVEEPISTIDNMPFTDRAAAAITAVFELLGSWDTIVSILPSSHVIFQELLIPFTDHEKIASVVRFEVEPMLPFSLDNATIDFIVTRQEKNESTVLVAAVKNEYLEQHLEPFYKAGVRPEKITVDIFELYGFYTTYEKERNSTILIDLDWTTTRLAYINNKQLIAVRTLPYGIAPNEHAQESIEKLKNLGFQEYDAQFTQNSKALIKDIAFTLQSFTQKSGIPSLPPITLTGSGSTLKELPEFLSQELSTPVFILEPKKLLTPTVKVQATSDRLRSAIVTLATALNLPTTRSFNLQSNIEEHSNLLDKQLLVGALLLSLSFLTFGSVLVYNLRKLNKEAQSSDTEAFTKLKKHFTIPPNRSISDALNAARSEINKEESIWATLANKNKFSFLKYLQELSSTLDRQGLGLQLKKLSISEDEITLEGSVKDFNALIILRQQLERSPLFLLVTPPQSIDFTSKPLRLSIKKEEEV